MSQLNTDLVYAGTSILEAQARVLEELRHVKFPKDDKFGTEDIATDIRVIADHAVMISGDLTDAFVSVASGRDIDGDTLESDDE